jgi:hypothetical protein
MLYSAWSMLDIQVLGRRRPPLPRSVYGAHSSAALPPLTHSEGVCSPSETGGDDERTDYGAAEATNLHDVKSDVVNNGAGRSGGAQPTALGRDIIELPASLTALPQLNSVIEACWQQRELRRPTAADVHIYLRGLVHVVLGRG